MDSMEINKIAASVFVAGIAALGISLAVNGLYDADAAEEAKRGYEIEVAEVAPTGAPEEEKPEQIAAYFQDADVAKGESLTKACLACHSFNEGGAHKVGPNLYAIVGAPKARAADYSYSNALASYGGDWDYQALSEFLHKPKKYVKGTKMAYAGMKKPEDRASLILYLRSLGTESLPLPEPPVEEEPEAKDGDAAPKVMESESRQDAPLDDSVDADAASDDASEPSDAADADKADGTEETSGDTPASN